MKELSPLKLKNKKNLKIIIKKQHTHTHPQPYSKAEDFEYAFRSVWDPIDEPWWIFLPWYIVLLIPAFDFLTSPSLQEGWQKSMCPHLSCSSPEPGILTQNLYNWSWDATLWTEANTIHLGGDTWHSVSHYRDGNLQQRDWQLEAGALRDL